MCHYVKKRRPVLYGIKTELRTFIRGITAGLFLLNTLVPAPGHAYGPGSSCLQVQSLFKPIIGGHDAEKEDQIRLEAAIISHYMMKNISGKERDILTERDIESRLPSFSELNADLDEWFAGIFREFPSSGRARILRVISNPRAVFETLTGEYSIIVYVEAIRGPNTGKNYRIRSHHESVKGQRSDGINMRIEELSLGTRGDLTDRYDQLDLSFAGDTGAKGPEPEKIAGNKRSMRPEAGAGTGKMPVLAGEGERWKDGSIYGPFSVSGGDYFAVEVTEYAAMAGVIERWFEGVDQDERDIARWKWMSAISPDEETGQSFLVKITDRAGEIVGLVLCRRSPIFRIIDGEVAGQNNGYLGNYAEIARGYRDMGLGRILIAKAAEGIMVRMGYPDVLDGDEGQRILFEVLEMDRPVMVVHPADQDAARFFERWDIGFIPVEFPSISEYGEDKPGKLEGFHVLSWGNAIDLVERVRALSAKDTLTQTLLPFVHGHGFPQIGKQFDILGLSVREGPEGPDSIKITAAEKEMIFTEQFVLHVTDVVPAPGNNAVADNARRWRDLALAMMDAFGSDIRVVFYDELFGDILGIADPGERIIAINKRLYPVRFMAIMHEIGEYLVASGTMELKFDASSRELYAEVGGHSFGPIHAGEVLDELAHEGETWTGQVEDSPEMEENRHYLLRILQRSIFGNLDRAFTYEIRRVLAEEAYDRMIYPLMGKEGLRFTSLEPEAREVLIRGGVGPKLVRLTEMQGKGARHFIEYGIGGLSRFGFAFIGKHWDEIMDAGLAAGDNAAELFQEGFHNSVGMVILSDYWDVFREIFRRAGRNSCYVLSEGLPLFYNLDSGFIDEIYFLSDRGKTVSHLEKISGVMIDIADNYGDDAGMFFKNGFEAVFRAARSEGGLEPALKRIHEMATALLRTAGTAAGGCSQERGAIYAGIGALVDVYGEAFVSEHWEELMSMLSSLDKGAAAPVAKFTLGAMKDVIAGESDPGKSGANIARFGGGLKAMEEICRGDPELTDLLFTKGIPSMIRAFGAAIAAEHWDTILGVALSAQDAAGYVLCKGLPLFSDMLKERKAPEEFSKDMAEIGRGLAEFGREAGEHKVYLFEVLPLFGSMVERDDPAGYIRIILRKLGRQLTGLASSAGCSRGLLFNDLIPGIFDVFGLEYAREEWEGLHKGILAVCENTTDHNRGDILTLILGREHLEAMKKRGADLTSNLEFYAAVLKERKYAAFNVLEGITEAVAGGLVPAVLKERDKTSILRFSGRMNSFMPLLYVMYTEKGEPVFDLLEDFAVRVHRDDIGPEEIKAFLHDDMFAGYSMSRREEIMVEAVKMRIPPSGSPSANRDSILGSMSDIMREGDRRGDVPEPLRGMDFGEGEKGAIPITLRSVGPGEAIDASGELASAVGLLRYGSSGEEPAEALRRDRERFLNSLTAYFGRPEDASGKKKCLDAFFVYASHRDVVRRKIEAVKGLGYHDLMVLEGLFNNELKDLIGEELKGMDPGTFPRKVSGEAAPVPDEERLKKNIKRIWSSGLDERSKLEAMRRVFSGMAPEEIRNRIIREEEEPSLRSFLERAVREMPPPGIVSYKEIRRELLKGMIDLIRRERKKFIEVSGADTSALEFRVVKGIPHGLWGFNAGVCVARDMELWRNQNFFLLEMYDIRMGRVAGYAELLSAEISGENVLTVHGINPSTEYLSRVRAKDLYPLIERALLRLKEAGGYAHLYLATPENEGNLTSNRPDMVKIASARYGESLTLPAKIYWNSLPEEYPFDKVWEIRSPVDSSADRSKIEERGATEMDRSGGVLSSSWMYEELHGVKPLEGVGKRVAVAGDIHGDLDALRDILENIGIIRKGADPDGTEDLWTGGSDRLTQGGDVPDRGRRSIEAFRYMRQLQEKARRSGGEVVRLIGNHELYYLYKHAEGRWKGHAQRLKNKGLIRGFDDELWDNDEEFVAMIREDVSNGSLVFTDHLGGKVFSHGVIIRDLVDDLGKEYGADLSDPENFVRAANETLKKAVSANRFDSAAFGAPPDGTGPRLKGIADRYFSELTRMQMERLPFDQVVFHDPVPFYERGRIAVITDIAGEKSVVNGDVGMTGALGGGRAAVVFEPGKVFAAYPSEEHCLAAGGRAELSALKRELAESLEKIRKKLICDALKEKFRALNREGLHLYRAVSRSLRDLRESAPVGDKMPDIDLVIDVSLISGDGIDMDLNAETIAFLIMLCADLDNVNFIFTKGMSLRDPAPEDRLPDGLKSMMKDSPDPDKFMEKVITAVKKGSVFMIDRGVEDTLTGIGMAGRIRTRDSSRPRVPGGGVEIPITSVLMLEWVRDGGKEILDDQYPVALEGPRTGPGRSLNVNDFGSAFMVALAKAALVIAERRAEEGGPGAADDLAMVRTRMVSRLKSLYRAAEVEGRLTEKIVGYLVSPDKTHRVNRAIEWFLPASSALDVDMLIDLHKYIQKFLKAA